MQLAKKIQKKIKATQIKTQVHNKKTAANDNRSSHDTYHAMNGIQQLASTVMSNRAAYVHNAFHRTQRLNTTK